MPSRSSHLGVFINCPFDEQFDPLFEAIVFTVFDCGFRPRCAREISDSAEVRIDKIIAIIRDCPYGIHDLSRTQLDSRTRLPRFNMPFELGMYLGAWRFGDRRQRSKKCLILDRSPYRYQKFISDISGQDIKSHGDRARRIVFAIRDWLRDSSADRHIPGGEEVYRRYRRFRRDLPRICSELRLGPATWTFNDFAYLVERWLKETVLST